MNVESNYIYIKSSRNEINKKKETHICTIQKHISEMHIEFKLRAIAAYKIKKNPLATNTISHTENQFKKAVIVSRMNHVPSTCNDSCSGKFSYN